MSRLLAVVPAAGSGSRMAVPTRKQFLEIGGRSLLDWSVAALLDREDIAQCAVALPAGEHTTSGSEVLNDSRVVICEGGATRADSVLSGIKALGADDDDWVLVHDAARPCLAAQDLDRLIGRVTETDVGGLLAVPVTDTIKRADDEQRVSGTVDRRSLWRAQTPQMFRVARLREALEHCAQQEVPVTDEASAMEALGHPVQLVEGNVNNLKVTYPEDMALATHWLTSSATAGAA